MFMSSIDLITIYSDKASGYISYEHAESVVNKWGSEVAQKNVLLK
jgi:hypothetical protein